MDEVFEGVEAEEGEHFLLVLFGGAKVAREEGKVLGRTWSRAGLRLRERHFFSASRGNGRH